VPWRLVLSRLQLTHTVLGLGDRWVQISHQQRGTVGGRGVTTPGGFLRNRYLVKRVPIRSGSSSGKTFHRAWPKDKYPNPDFTGAPFVVWGTENRPCSSKLGCSVYLGLQIRAKQKVRALIMFGNPTGPTPGGLRVFCDLDCLGHCWVLGKRAALGGQIFPITGPLGKTLGPQNMLEGFQRSVPPWLGDTWNIYWGPSSVPGLSLSRWAVKQVTESAQKNL